eukprot:3721509-Rhodomonas_salina.1
MPPPYPTCCTRLNCTSACSWTLRIRCQNGTLHRTCVTHGYWWGGWGTTFAVRSACMSGCHFLHRILPGKREGGRKGE